MVVFQFPPFAMSSGVQRALRFVQQLPALGWQPDVLTAHPRAYASTADDLLREVPLGTVVQRAFALDAARHLAVAGRYPGFLARPDRWSSWYPGAVLTGIRMIRRHRPDVIWSTYPIATAHAVAVQLHRWSGIPLVADFRDPMAQDGYPQDPRVWRSFDRIERAVAGCARRMVFVTPSALELYRKRYAALPPDRFSLIENGYDEESFARAERDLTREALNPGVLTLLHSGVVYPSERDPIALFAALGALRRSARLGPDRVRLRFRAPVHEDLLHRLAAESGTADLIEILPAIAYREALAEMLRADGLVLMQGSNCNEQIPAKLYEYVRAGRPLLGLADPNGDSGRTLRRFGVKHIATLESAGEIESALLGFVDALATGRLAPPRAGDLSRLARSRDLAALLDAVAAKAALRGAPAAQ
ncbi:MAG: glycosyltransferase [Piscinibacter sp.]|uniref:glycosyltransferase n=1 Tax=Piscinibacter sp. TaxID=1903157 RepID=UPI0025851EB5|nr:glycosyltransferase [Piscinibacter sp.]MCW5662468.1 glycosyltransferase [Piscinibacter sp.]